MGLMGILGLGNDEKSKIAKFEKGVFPCSKCNKKLPIAEYAPLNMINCPKCDDLNLVPLKLDQWWVYKPIGSGGMGAVYQARHIEDPDVKGAVKVLQANEVRENIIELLLAEAKIGHKFGDHENMAQVFAYGKDNGNAYMVMEMVDGIRLDQIMDIAGGFDLELSLYYALDILIGLQHMYEAGYLYRDLKPENIIIAPDNKVVLVDYGLCMELMEAWQYDGDDILGSPLYMPPERIKGQGEDIRADMYSLGMVLYQLIKGQPYFNAKDIMNIVKSQIKNVRLQTSSKMSGIPEDVQVFVDTLIRLERDERYNYYTEAMQVLVEILGGMKKNKKTTDPRIQQRRKALSKLKIN
ncbi:protein kinase [Lentisphaera profundi]|uniref:non-specific serine/threonine protein kinase n=1 Tax=Lentisphaera profundi TaxID=1658616 RepID=A0ABY7VYL8_9BACT|nr:serine/threonine-protein kinase [Lentisphaera profundi]WDE99270.1 protein kinase [Lentisphaera profundi]